MLTEVNGFEGRVQLSGRAVAGLFNRWELRREGSGEWAWSLHAVLSYQKETLLRHPKFQRKVLVKVVGVDPYKGVWYEVRVPEGASLQINGDDLSIKGAALCRADQTGLP